jgi:hypothetical protein
MRANCNPATTDCTETAPTLLSFEQRLVAHYITQSKQERWKILLEAVNEPSTSGPLITVYKYMLTA